MQPFNPGRKRMADFYRDIAIELMKADQSLAVDIASLNYWGEQDPICKEVVDDVRAARAKLGFAVCKIAMAFASIHAGATDDAPMPEKGSMVNNHPDDEEDD